MLIRLRVVDSCLKPQAESRSPVASKAKYLLSGHLQKVCQLPLPTDASQMLMDRQSPSIWSWPQPHTTTECEVGSAALNSRRLTAKMEANLGNIVKFSCCQRLRVWGLSWSETCDRRAGSKIRPRSAWERLKKAKTLLLIKVVRLLG